MEPTRVLLIANRTAANPPLLGAVRERAARGVATFHLVVPATPTGLHRSVDPEDAGRDAAREQLSAALPLLSEAAGHAVTGHVGDANPLCAAQDALNLGGFDEIILSTLPWRISQWLRVDLPRKIAALGVPVLHVQASIAPSPRQLRAPAPAEVTVSLPADDDGFVGGQMCPLLSARVSPPTCIAATRIGPASWLSGRRG
ncbi:MAG TPA: hypothetical protein VJ741_10070 [Solirubrobacteraceae bacterium]|nr:hypothetical protein [Solirubrobacteraceae bacterium]